MFLGQVFQTCCFLNWRTINDNISLFVLALITFSCTARILKGDRFVGPLQDKARRYKRQFEALYQRSILGQSFVSCVVDKFGDDAQTIYFKLAFNRKKLTK